MTDQDFDTLTNNVGVTTLYSNGNASEEGGSTAQTADTDSSSATDPESSYSAVTINDSTITTSAGDDDGESSTGNGPVFNAYYVDPPVANAPTPTVTTTGQQDNAQVVVANAVSDQNVQNVVYFNGITADQYYIINVLIPSLPQSASGETVTAILKLTDPYRNQPSGAALDDQIDQILGGKLSPGQFPNENGEAFAERMTAVHSLIVDDFPVYAAETALHVAMMVYGPEDLAAGVAAGMIKKFIQVAQKSGLTVKIANGIAYFFKNGQKANADDLLPVYREVMYAERQLPGPEPVGQKMLPAPNTTLLTIPGRVQSRINLANKGWQHLVDMHFSGKTNKSQFTVTQAQLRGILQSKQVVNTPITTTLVSTKGTLYVRYVYLNRQIGLDKFNNFNPTNIMSVLTDAAGNLVTASPGIIR